MKPAAYEPTAPYSKVSRIAREAQELASRRADKALKTVLFVPSGLGSRTAILNDVMLACALIVRGMRVVPVSLGPLVGNEHTEELVWKEIAGLQPISVRRFTDKHDLRLSEVYADSITPDTYGSVTRGGFAVGREAAEWLECFTRTTDFDNAEQLQALKAHVAETILHQCAYQRIFRDITPSAVVLSGWAKYPWTTPARHARSCNIPAYVVELQQDAVACRYFNPQQDTENVGFIELSTVCNSREPGIDFGLAIDSVQQLLPGKDSILDWLCDSISSGSALGTAPTASVSPAKQPEARDLQGFDEMGEVSLLDNVVRRKIFPGMGNRVRQLIESDRQIRFSQFGLISALISEERENANSHLTLEHPRVPVITYAHEWPTEMVREAVCFEITLQQNLVQRGFFLKDFGALLNVLFEGPKPVWVDYLSVSAMKDLPTQAWLLEDLPVEQFGKPLLSCFFSQMWRRIFTPHSTLPLALLSSGSPNARKRILETAMNTSEQTLEFADLSGAPAELLSLIAESESRIARCIDSADLYGALSCASEFVRALPNPFTYSGYVDYYREKNEEFSFEPSAAWKPKQVGVYEALHSSRPKTVLDIGANTGWFSILAAKLGAHVTACEIDEACANVLYKKARELSVPVLPLVIDFLDLQPEVPAWSGYSEENCSRLKASGKRAPVLLGAEERFRSDAVMALAIIHHLVLGMGKTLDDVIGALMQLTKQTLIVEFVDLADPLIAAEPDFFPALKRDRNVATGYSRENLEKILGTQFSNVTAQPLSPSRHLYVARK